MIGVARELKILPHYYQEVIDGTKGLEYKKNEWYEE